MNNLFTYSILQYKHSSLVREAINVGILFAFFEENKLEFVFGNAHRVRAIYPNFDPSIFNSSLKNIQNTISKESHSIFRETNLKANFREFVNNNLLSEDSTVLQFTEPVTAIAISDRQKTIKDYSELLLPGIDSKKSEVTRHNEAFILRKYSNYLFENNKELYSKIKREAYISYNDVRVKFDLTWQNGSLNYVKALAFDLKEEQDIQNKSATYYGYLTLLSQYAQDNNSKFDILVSKPQDRKLYKEYSKALKILGDIPAPKEIVEESGLKKYSEKTLQSLLDI